MKKIIFTLSIIALLFAVPAFAGDNVSDAEGTMALTDATGGGPGVLGLAISAASYAAYSAATGTGGYTASATGQTMAAQAYSTKADGDIQLMFAVRSSMVPGDADDNRVYQDPAAGTAFTSANISLTTDFSTSADFLVRGGS